MKDFLGNELAVGDEVVFTDCHGDFETGEIADIADDGEVILFIVPQNFWLYLDKALKVIRQ